MPNMPLKACNRCGQGHRNKTGYCDNCKPSQQPDRDNASQRGYGYRWQKLRAVYLNKNTLAECERCLLSNCKDRGRDIPADTVHHIKPVATHPDLRYRFDNLLAVARVCHERIHQRQPKRVYIND